MPYNYTISTFQITETQGDAVFFATMFTEGQFVITPNDGYVVYAADFSHGALPDTVSSAAFTDSTTAGAIDNTVICTCQLASQLELTSSLLPIVVPITGHARVFVGNETRETFTIQLHDKNYDINKGVTSVAAEAGVTKTVSTVNGVYIHQLQGVADVNTPTKIAAITYITNSSTDPHYITVEPYLTHIGIDSDKVYYIFTDMTAYDDGDIYAYYFDVMINTDIALDVDNNERMFVNHLYAQRSTSTTEVTNVVHGPTQLSPTGETRPITIYGDPDAEFDLTVTTDRDDSSILSAANANTTISDGIYGSISAIYKKLESAGDRAGLASFTFNQNFPAHTPVLTGTVAGTRSNDAYVIINEDASSLRVGDRVRDTAGTEILGGTWVTITSVNTATKRLDLSEEISITNGVGIKFFREEKYYINLYARSGTTLGSNIPTITPHYTLTQYHASNPVLTLTTSETDGSYTGPTNTYTYTGRANTYPSRLKHTINGSTDFFQISYTITGTTFAAVGSTAGKPTWSSTDSTTSHWSNSTYADNGGTHIEIYNIKVGGIGTTTYTLTADVLIKKWGTKNVTMNLDLDQIIT